MLPAFAAPVPSAYTRTPPRAESSYRGSIPRTPCDIQARHSCGDSAGGRTSDTAEIQLEALSVYTPFSKSPQENEKANRLRYSLSLRLTRESMTPMSWKTTPMSRTGPRILILLKTLKIKRSRWVGSVTTLYLRTHPHPPLNFAGSGEPKPARHAL